MADDMKMHEKKPETPEQKVEREKLIEIERVRAEAERAFWGKVPNAGNDPDTGVEAEYMIDGDITPEGRLISIDGHTFYSLGGQTVVDGKSLTKVVPYITKADIVTDDAVLGVFPAEGEKYSLIREWHHSSVSGANSLVVIEKGSPQIFQKLLGVSIMFTDEEIGMREYRPAGRGDAVYVLDKNSDRKINVKGHVFRWVSNGSFRNVGSGLRYEDEATGIPLIFLASTHVKEFLGSLIQKDDIKILP